MPRLFSTLDVFHMPCDQRQIGSEVNKIWKAFMRKNCILYASDILFRLYNINNIIFIIFDLVKYFVCFYYF